MNFAGFSDSRKRLPCVLIALVGVVAASCASSGQNGKTQAKVEKPGTGSGDRPGDGGEGVPGYLADPNAVSFVMNGATITVAGKSGAVTLKSAPVDVTIWSIATNDLTTFYKSPKSMWSVSATLLAKTTTEGGGGFSAQALAPAEGFALIITLESQDQPTRLNVANSNESHVTTVARDPNYSSLDFHGPEFA